jgi:hypothetical protein
MDERYVPATTLPSTERLLLVDLSERERHELGEQLVGAGFEVMVALNHADVCLRLLTCRPDGIIADGDLASIEVDELANLIRESSAVPVALVLLCKTRPLRGVPATVLLKPVAFPDLLSALRTSFGDR